MSDTTPSLGLTGDPISATQMSMLLDAMASSGREIRLDPVLRRVVACATDLVDARYGALGILDARRLGLAYFVHVGLTEEEADAIGSLPLGHGLLGQLVRDPRPLRLSDLTEDAGATGFPGCHPHMSSFLGVPVRVRGDVLGNLYLTDKRNGRGFSAEDEQLVVALAAVAGVAVENARLHARVSELATIEHRERTARELHDTVIQRIFGVGLALEGVSVHVDDAGLSGHLRMAAADLGETVQQIQKTVFDLELDVDLDRRSAWHRPVCQELTDFVDEVAEGLGMATSFRFDGDIDGVVGVECRGTVTDHLFAASREAIVALREHIGAERADISLAVGTELTLHIVADSHRHEPPPADWLHELEDRAQALGGRVASTRSQAGTEITWTVPLTAT